ncbi:hypothetical protein QVD99_002352 [Batrachochytrium dendrobatidis]|nr:hypothetical protein QVD99_002352 [Batrachochytrium dendrobatidis]
MIVPLPSSSNDVSLTPQHTPSGEPVTIDYKGEEYKGISSDTDVTIPGNTDITAKCGTDGTSVAWVESPTTDRHTVNIRIILVDDEQVDLPERFQQVVENGRTLYSYIHTCFLYMRFPEVVVSALVDAILDSGAITVKNNMLKRKLSPEDIDNIFWKHYPMLKSSFDIDWDKLPSLTIVMYSETPVTDDNRNSVVAIKLGPKDYIQRIDSKNFVFSVEVGPSDNAILGIPFMNRLGLTFDLENARIGFGPGCGCEVWLMDILLFQTVIKCSGHYHNCLNNQVLQVQVAHLLSGDHFRDLVVLSVVVGGQSLITRKLDG